MTDLNMLLLCFREKMSVDSQFVCVEGFVTAIYDQYERHLQGRRGRFNHEVTPGSPPGPPGHLPVVKFATTTRYK